MANKGSVVNGLLEHMALRVIAKLNVDSLGRLRVAAETATATVSGTVTANVGVVGAVTAQGYSQLETMKGYHGSFRRNLIQS